MSEYLEKTRSALEEIDSVKRKLESLSMAFYTTGNITMCEKLEAAATRLKHASETLKDESHENIREQYQQSQEASANMFRACLAGTEIGREGNHE